MGWKMKKSIVASAALIILAAILAGCSGDPQVRKQKYFNSGLDYLKKGKYQESILQFQNALKLDPHYVDAFYHLAQAQFASYEWREAYTNLQHAIQLDPTRVDARLSLGNLYLAARDFPNARDEASYALQRDPNSAPAHELMGMTLLMERQPDNALRELSKVVELDPRSPSGYINLALVEVGLGRNDDAEKHFEQAVSVAPRSAQPYINLANFYRLQRQMPRAEEVLQQGAKLNPDTVSLYIAWADLLYSGQRKDAAEAVIDSMRRRPLKPAQVALAAGDFYFARKETERALAEYRRGLAADPKNLEIQNHMVECYLGSDRIEEARKWNAAVLSQRPQDVYAGIAKARILLASGKRDDAIAEFRRLASQAQDLPQVHYYLAQAYRQNQSLEEAKTELLETLRMAPSMVAAQHSLAELYLAQRDLDSAQALSEEIVRKNPADAAARALLGAVFLQRGETAKALDQFLAARQVSPTPLMAVNLGRVYASERKWADAQKAFEDALRLDPRFVQALDGLASLWVQQKKPAQALSRMEQYVAAYPQDAAGYLILGSLHADLKQYDQARSELAQAARLDSTLVMARIRLADICRLLGDIPAAIQAYEEVLRLQPKSPAVHTVLGDLYQRQRNLPMAQKHYEEALAIDPGFALAANNLAWLYAQDNGGNLDVALSLAQKAKELQPELLNSTDTLGWIVYKKGLYREAIQLFRECVTKAPDSGTYRFHLGMALLGAGDRKQGKAQLEAALHMTLAPENTAQARQALNQTN
jgi:tetratricopeptide (TPR) repeat protein